MNLTIIPVNALSSLIAKHLDNISVVFGDVI